MNRRERACHTERACPFPTTRFIDDDRCHSEPCEESPNIDDYRCHSEHREESPHIQNDQCHSEHREEPPVH